tara:strand:+ start:255 stop:1424 length:1170 start_codon:yes stop_codon:yes gene_type:complete
MKKLLGIMVLSLLLSGNAYAKKVLFSSEDFIIIKDRFFTYGNDKIAKEHCFRKDKYFIRLSMNGDVSNKPANYVRYYCAKSRSDFIKNLEKLNKTLPKQFYSASSDRPLKKESIFSTNVPNINVADVSSIPIDSFPEFTVKEKVSEKPKKQEPEKKKPKTSPDDNKVVVGSSGSGFFVSKEGHLITNFHVIDRCDNVKINFKGDQLETKILAIDKVNDIAILKTDFIPSNIFPVSNIDVSLLEDIIVAGFPKGKKISSAIKTSKGVVTALAGAGDNYSEFQTDTVINAGNSGGPIINQKGNIVGIAVSSWIEEGVEGIHFGIKSSTLKTFASANGLNFLPPNDKELSNKDLGKLITEATLYLECHLTIAKLKKMIAEANNRKAFFSEYN